MSRLALGIFLAMIKWTIGKGMSDTAATRFLQAELTTYGFPTGKGLPPLTVCVSFLWHFLGVSHVTRFQLTLAVECCLPKGGTAP